ncbi:MAG: hypothetical protein F6K17_19865 [Okeania sp. SIO3C4]|nr:hypothetical protein [Okeania sp. SIO3C4]
MTMGSEGVVVHERQGNTCDRENMSYVTIFLSTIYIFQKLLSQLQELYRVNFDVILSQN